MHACASGFAVLVLLFGRAEGVGVRSAGTDGAGVDGTSEAHEKTYGKKEHENIPSSLHQPKQEPHKGPLGGRQLRAVIRRWRARGKLEWAVVWAVPVVFIVTAGVEAFIAGSCVGGL